MESHQAGGPGSAHRRQWPREGARVGGRQGDQPRGLRALPVWAPLPAPCFCDPRAAAPHSARERPPASVGGGALAGWVRRGGVFNCRSQPSTAGRPWGLPAPGRGLGFPAAPRVQSVADCAPPSGACLEQGRGPPLLVPTLSACLPEIRPQLSLGFPGESSCSRLHAGGS